MNIKKKLQQLFKNIFQKLFFLIYGRVKYKNNLKKFDYKITPIKKIFLNKNLSFKTSNYLYEIPNGRLYTDIVEHVAIIKNNTIVPEISYQQIKGELKSINFNKVLKTGTPRIVKNFNGNVLSLVQGASGNNYFHFLFDIITKLKLCDQVFSLKQIQYFYVPSITEWQKKIFSLFNIQKEQLIDSKIYRHIKASNLIALDHPWYKRGFVQTEIKNIPIWIVVWLRNFFLKYAKPFKCSDKIFIDRSDSDYSHCKLINNSEIIKNLKKKGFKSYQVSKLNFAKQVFLFNNAKIIVGPHGAAFSNIIFCKKKTKIIEIIPKDHQSKKCQRISKILKFKYIRVKLDRVFNNSFGDMIMNAKRLEKIIKNY